MKIGGKVLNIDSVKLSNNSCIIITLASQKANESVQRRLVAKYPSRRRTTYIQRRNATLSRRNHVDNQIRRLYTVDDPTPEQHDVETTLKPCRRYDFVTRRRNKVENPKLIQITNPTYFDVVSTLVHDVETTSIERRFAR